MRRIRMRKVAGVDGEQDAPNLEGQSVRYRTVKCFAKKSYDVVDNVLGATNQRIALKTA